MVNFPFFLRRIYGKIAIGNSHLRCSASVALRGVPAGMRVHIYVPGGDPIHREVAREKFSAIKAGIHEAFRLTRPIILIVALLCLLLIPVAPWLLLSFLMGALMVVVGMGLFTLGTEISMSFIGTHIGSTLTKSRNSVLILAASFILGVAITVAEPDLQVLAETVPHIDNTVLLITVGLGVGFFLAVSMLRIMLGIKLRWLLIFFYALVFLLALFSDKDFLGAAFDSGGVASGPMTSGFILPLAVGACVALQGEEAVLRDGFGVVALVAMTPLITIQLLGFKGIVAEMVNERKAMKRILDADDQQIINFM